MTKHNLAINQGAQMYRVLSRMAILGTVVLLGTARGEAQTYSTRVTAADSLAIERAALRATGLERMAQLTRVIFDEIGQRRVRGDSVNALLRREFNLGAVGEAERGRCSATQLDCPGLPTGVTVIDLSTPRIADGRATIVVRSMVTGTRLNGLSGTFGSATTYTLSKIEGEWRVIGVSMTAM